MADLLECLIQIKGVADTPRRLARHVADALAVRHATPRVEPMARSVVLHLASAEVRFRECLDAMLAQAGPLLPPMDDRPAASPDDVSLAEWQQRFAEVRQATVLVLERCSAEDLGRIGIDPSRGPMTVADLVALMLAHDTDQLGRLVNVARDESPAAEQRDAGPEINRCDLAR